MYSAFNKPLSWRCPCTAPGVKERRVIKVPAFYFIFLPVVTLADDYEVLRNFKTVLWPQAYRTQDVDLLDRLLHDSFGMIDDEGNRSTKKKELEHISNNQWDPGTFEYRIERLQIYQGSFALSTVLVSLSPTPTSRVIFLSKKTVSGGLLRPMSLDIGRQASQIIEDKLGFLSIRLLWLIGISAVFVQLSLINNRWRH